MRQITRDAANALLNHQNFKRDNTEVLALEVRSQMWLHDSCIATCDGDVVHLNNRGYATATTKERLNGILSAIGHPDRIVQRSGVWYLGDDVFPNNTWVKVK